MSAPVPCYSSASYAVLVVRCMLSEGWYWPFATWLCIASTACPANATSGFAYFTAFTSFLEWLFLTAITVMDARNAERLGANGSGIGLLVGFVCRVGEFPAVKRLYLSFCSVALDRLDRTPS